MSKTRQIRLSDTLTRGMTPHERVKVEDSFKAAPGFIRALADRLEKNLEEKIKASEGLTQYMNLSWSEWQADNKGYRRALRDILNLFIEYK